MTEQQKQWVVVKTQTGRENWAALNITNQGCDVYLPRVLCQPKRRVAKQELVVLRAEPLFACYLFVQIKGTWRFLTGTFGVAGLVLRGNSPAIVSDAIIADLKRREDADGLVVLPEVAFAPNDHVQVRSGSHEGQVGIYRGIASQHRVRVLMQYLGGEREVLIPETMVEPAAA